LRFWHHLQLIDLRELLREPFCAASDFAEMQSAYFSSDFARTPDFELFWPQELLLLKNCALESVSMSHGEDIISFQSPMGKL